MRRFQSNVYTGIRKSAIHKCLLRASRLTFSLIPRTIQLGFALRCASKAAIRPRDRIQALAAPITCPLASSPHIGEPRALAFEPGTGFSGGGRHRRTGRGQRGGQGGPAGGDSEREEQQREEGRHHGRKFFESQARRLLRPVAPGATYLLGSPWCLSLI